MRMPDPIILSEFRSCGTCENCSRRVYPLDPHHLWCKGMGGGGLDVRVNLIALCRICHSEIQEAGKAIKRTVLDIVAIRENVHAQDIETVVHFLRRLRKDESFILRADAELADSALKLACKTWTEWRKNVDAAEPKPRRCGIGGKKARR
jgi:hypothetical protein